MFFRNDIDVSCWPEGVERSLLMEVLLLNHEVKSKTYIASLLKYWVFMLAHWVALQLAIAGVLITEWGSLTRYDKRDLLQGVALIFVIPFLIAWFAFTHVKKEEALK